MFKEFFPEGQVVYKNKPFTPEFFTLTLDEIDNAGESFIGVIRVDEQDSVYFLFFLKGDAYAAGCLKKGEPKSLSINDFIEHMSNLKKGGTISLFKIDPVLFKGMLVFLQREPSIRISTESINLDDLFSQIKSDGVTTFLILKKGNRYNFFYFHFGQPKMAHLADSSQVIDGIAVAERMLMYAYPEDKTPVEMFVYSDIKTTEASDTAEAKPSAMKDAIMQKTRESVKEALPVSEKKISGETASMDEAKINRPGRIRIEIIGGVHKGNKFNVPLPCSVGRRDADIRIRDMTISKRHISFEAFDDMIILKDLNSTNGTFLNGQEVREAVLSDGDIIQIGDTSLRIQFVTH